MSNISQPKHVFDEVCLCKSGRHFYVMVLTPDIFERVQYSR